MIRYLLGSVTWQKSPTELELSRLNPNGAIGASHRQWRSDNQDRHLKPMATNGDIGAKAIGTTGANGDPFATMVTTAIHWQSNGGYVTNSVIEDNDDTLLPTDHPCRQWC